MTTKKVIDVLQTDENIKLVEELVASGKKEGEALVEIAAKLGYEVTAEELAKTFAEARELDDEDLEEVSGGMLWFGEDAPDGHEIGCFRFYYAGWDDYNQTKVDGRCVHQYDNRIMNENYTGGYTPNYERS